MMPYIYTYSFARKLYWCFLLFYQICTDNFLYIIRKSKYHLLVFSFHLNLTDNYMTAFIQLFKCRHSYKWVRNLQKAMS